MLLQKKDGSTISWNASTIANYRYDAITAIADAERINNAEVKIYPNPFKGSVRIRFELPVADKVAVDIIDMQGRNIRSWPLCQKPAGTHELLWQTSDNGGKTIPSGTYICRITTTKGSVSKMIVME
jgi:flagellar hook assembly protein FlgD